MTAISQITGTREEWLAARLDLLEAEKELTRLGDELARRRRELPAVRIEKEYRFETAEGNVSLAELFRGRSQLIVYHFMFGPDYKAGCPSCSAIADGFNGIFVHLENHDVAFTAVSRAPFAQLDAYRQRMAWTFPWASSSDGSFNFDYNVSITEEHAAQGKHRVQLCARPSPDRPLAPSRARRGIREDVRHERAGVCARAAGDELLLARGWRRLSQLFDVRARAGRTVGDVPVARPRTEGTQRAGHLVEAAR